MKKSKFEKLKKYLTEKCGYKIYQQHWHHEDYVIGKGFHKSDNKWEEDRSAIQVLLSVYDHSLHPEYKDRLPADMQDRVGIEIHFDVSRTIDERVEMAMAWHENLNIEDVESQAEKFYKWVLDTWTEPREEKPKQD